MLLRAGVGPADPLEADWCPPAADTTHVSPGGGRGVNPLEADGFIIERFHCFRYPL